MSWSHQTARSLRPDLHPSLTRTQHPASVCGAVGTSRPDCQESGPTPMEAAPQQRCRSHASHPGDHSCPPGPRASVAPASSAPCGADSPHSVTDGACHPQTLLSGWHPSELGSQTWHENMAGGRRHQRKFLSRCGLRIRGLRGSTGRRSRWGRGPRLPPQPCPQGPQPAAPHF